MGKLWEDWENHRKTMGKIMGTSKGDLLHHVPWRKRRDFQWLQELQLLYRAKNGNILDDKALQVDDFEGLDRVLFPSPNLI